MARLCMRVARTGLKMAQSFHGQLRILMVNDVYSFKPNAEKTGGFAQLKTMLQSYQTPESLFFLTGDFLGGSHLAEFCEGESVIEIMNQFKLDGVVIGNHEFDYGAEVCMQRLADSQFPWYGANVFDKRTGGLMKGLLPYKVVEGPLTGRKSAQEDSAANGKTIKIGLFGVLTTKTPHLAYPGEHMEFRDVMPIAQECVAALKAQGAELIIALTHLSITEDKQLAREVKGIDVILGGHDHSPVQVFVGSTFIMKCGQNAEFLGVLDMEIDILTPETEQVTETKVAVPAPTTAAAAVAAQYHFYPTWQVVANRNYALDPTILEIIHKYEQKAIEESSHIDHNEVLAVVVGELKLSSKTEEVRFHSNAFGQMLSDSMFWWYDSDLKLASTTPDFAVINGGFVRGNKTYKVGHEFTNHDCLFVELPFPKHAVVLEMTGAAVMRALEQMLILSPASNSAFPHVSKELQVVCDLTKPVLSRIQSVTLLGQPLNPTEKYSVVVSYFMAIGGDGCSAWKEHVKTSEDGNEAKIQDIFASYLKHIKHIDAATTHTPRTKLLHT
jgi:2',3'-cyclic-nucleotide 2'-phosphodiesterase (5'-nucleotidase family)